jgi:hypothetical protein
MLLLKKNEDQNQEGSDSFGYTSKYINDELELIQTQQENVIRVAEELETALAQADKMKELIVLLKKTDKLITEKQIGERRKQQAKMTNLMEDIKELLRQQKYEDIERLMLQVHQASQLKLSLSREELKDLKGIMDQLGELYKQSAGLCRIYLLIHEHVKQIYTQCSQEFGIETAEEVELSGAGAYTERIH